MFTETARAPGKAAAWGACSVAVLILGLSPVAASAAAAPPIRTSTSNAVPQCVTPQRLMDFVKSRNPAVEPRFAGIANLYKRHGEAWRVRWDYAFFQMAVETNFLSFKRGDGGWGDVKPRQNNFAGLGTTGGGVPGDSYPDVDTGVLAQIQHLVVYSGEPIADPVGPRTKLKQDDILKSIAHLKGGTTFTDLSRRWAADRYYGAAIEWVAGNYRATYCTQDAAEAKAKPKPRPAKPLATNKTQLAAANAQFPPAAALGGPGAKGSDADTPPVRTIWSRSTQPAQPAAAAETPKPAGGPVPRTVAPPASEKAPVPAAGAPAQAEAVKEPIAVPAPVEVTPPPRSAPRSAPSTPPPQPVLQPASTEEPRPFAFAAAMVAAASAPPPADAARCRVFSASYGGTKTLLVRARAGSELHYTALTVLDGFEDSMLAGYVKAHAPGGSRVGTFDTRDAALTKAGELCPGTADAPRVKDRSAG